MNLICHMNMLKAISLTNDKHFLKTIRQQEFDYCLSTKLLRIIFAP